MEKRTPDWPNLIAEFESSGLSAAGFAKSRDLPLSTLRYYIKKSRKSEPAGRRKSAGFVELPVPLNSPQTAGKEKRSAVTITIAGVNIRVEVGS